MILCTVLASLLVSFGSESDPIPLDGPVIIVVPVPCDDVATDSDAIGLWTGLKFPPDVETETAVRRLQQGLSAHQTAAEIERLIADLFGLAHRGQGLPALDLPIWENNSSASPAALLLITLPPRIPASTGMRLRAGGSLEFIRMEPDLRYTQLGTYLELGSYSQFAEEWAGRLFVRRVDARPPMLRVDADVADPCCDPATNTTDPCCNNPDPCCGNPDPCCGVNCDDGNPCTSDSCVNGGCVHGNNGCDDGNPCTHDACVDGNCVYTPVCPPDSNPCTEDYCQDGNCHNRPLNCDDNNVCTTDYCDNGTCVHEWNCPPPDDPCMERVCVNGHCEIHPKNCDDNNVCTTDSCNPSTGECIHEWNCPPDPDPCKERVCVDGNCQYQPKNCDDGVACTDDSCDPATGRCHHVWLCDDQNGCTEDLCINDDCAYRWLCTDDDPCTINTCVNGRCHTDPKDCNDYDMCTRDHCDPETGACIHDPHDCNDYNACSMDYCDPETGQCYYIWTDCDDHNACTRDRCDPDTGNCIYEQEVDCNDGNCCTIDSCDPQTAECHHILVTGGASISGPDCLAVNHDDDVPPEGGQDRDNSVIDGALDLSEDVKPLTVSASGWDPSCNLHSLTLCASGEGSVRIFSKYALDGTQILVGPGCVTLDTAQRPTWNLGVEGVSPGKVTLLATHYCGGVELGHYECQINVVQIEFIESEEVAGMDLLPLFNPNPIVTLDLIANPGTAESVNITVSGKVKDYVAPVATVRINGSSVNVTQTGSGQDNLGPFEGTFTTSLGLTGNTTLVSALAINSLSNVGEDSTLIEVNRDTSFNITSRTVTERESVPPQLPGEPAYLDSFRFRIEVVDADANGNELSVPFNTGVETKTVKLTRDGQTSTFRSKNLFLCPNNLQLPNGAPPAVVETRIKADLGKQPEVTYAVCNAKDVAATKGTLLRKRTDDTVTDRIESAVDSDVTSAPKGLCYDVAVGLHGSAGFTIDVKLHGLNTAWAPLAQPEVKASFPALEPVVTLKRQSDDSTNPKYHLYRLDAAKSVMGVRTPLPVNTAGAPQNNANLFVVFVTFDGALQCKYEPDAQLTLVEPVVGMELVAPDTTAPHQYAAAGIMPVNAPVPPIISVADGAPRPIIESFTVTYTPASGPRRFRVQATIKDQVADLVDGNTLAAVGMSLSINGVTVPNSAVTITRPTNNPPRPFSAAVDYSLDLDQLFTTNDIVAYTARRAIGIGAPEVPTLKVSQQAVILQATNALGNRSWDSAFVLLQDTNADGAPPFVASINNGPGTNPPTLFDVPPQLFTFSYHNPFSVPASISQKIESVAAEGVFSDKQVTLKRALWGDSYTYGPWIVGAPDRWVVGAPSIPVAMPVVAGTKYTHDGNGVVATERAATSIKIDAPAPSRADSTFSLPIDVRFSDVSAGGNLRDALLPTGSDSSPTTIYVTTSATTLQASFGIPASVRNAITASLRLRDVTHFTGYCTNAPRAGTPGLTNDDFSFNSSGNNPGPTTAVAFNSSAVVASQAYSKDYGGRAAMEASIAIPGSSARTILTQIIVDDDGDFLPRAWERLFRNSPGTTDINNPIRDGLDDSEDRVLNGSSIIHNEKGDGYAALEEYRGFSITYGTGSHPLATRMNDIPFAYMLTPTLTPGPVTGPRVKDVLVFHQSTVVDGATGNLAMSVTDAALSNIAYHKIAEDDMRVPQPSASIVHDHQMNFNGDNDGLTVEQNAVHMRDATLGAGTLGNASSFYLSDDDVRIDPANAGGSYGFTAGQINGNTIFHELGHKVSLRHCHNTTSQGITVFTTALSPLNNTDVTSPAGGAPDGINDGALRVMVATYTRATDPPGTTSARGSMAETHFINNSNAGAYQAFITHGSDSYGIVIDRTMVWASTPFTSTTTYYSRVLFPSLMDWMDYWIAGTPSGPTQQQNFNERQIFTNPGAPPPAATPLHREEIRVRSEP